MNIQTPQRYADATQIKATGSTYTPKILADFVARNILGSLKEKKGRRLRILDPALGDGELLVSLLDRIDVPVDVFGYETDSAAIERAAHRIKNLHPNANINFHHGDFLEHVLEDFDDNLLFDKKELYDIVIANPPYVRTQVMGANEAKRLGKIFGLTGRVDLYHAFLLGMARVLHPEGTAGFIVSNRFMTTKGGASARKAMINNFNLVHVFDLGDTKIFDAAVLPAILIGNGTNLKRAVPKFTSSYETSETPQHHCASAIEALQYTGSVGLPNGRAFDVQHGHLDTGGKDDGLWRLTSKKVESWLKSVTKKTYCTFRDVGKIRVGVKTCADKVFIPKTWDHDLELHHPLTTHHIARRFRANPPSRKILYPHAMMNDQKHVVDISLYPKSRAYLEKHRETLEKRKYVIEAGRKWYELWVPQHPGEWHKPKLVFRDIAEQPTFWMDLDGTVVNGDCYWMTGEENALWLALAVGNSTFIEHFYDSKFNNKLYAGRRRFITQYVEHFPLPDPEHSHSLEIIELCRTLYENPEAKDAKDVEQKLDSMVWRAFALTPEKARG